MIVYFTNDKKYVSQIYCLGHDCVIIGANVGDFKVLYGWKCNKIQQDMIILRSNWNKFNAIHSFV